MLRFPTGCTAIHARSILTDVLAVILGVKGVPGTKKVRNAGRKVIII